MRFLFQRIVHNDRAWKCPSGGRLRFTGDGTYLANTGFAHEDWNFCPDLCANGYVYGYMYYRPKDPKGPFNVVFATYDKGEGWALCGYYENVTFDENGAKFPLRVLHRRAKELKVLDTLDSLGGAYRRASLNQITRYLTD